jgi:hypothetical protein
MPDIKIEEAEELLARMQRDLEPLTREEVCNWYGIAFEDFPRLAIANLERQLEGLRETAGVFRNAADAKSLALVRQINTRIDEIHKLMQQWSLIAEHEQRDTP